MDEPKMRVFPDEWRGDDGVVRVPPGETFVLELEFPMLKRLFLAEFAAGGSAGAEN